MLNFVLIYDSDILSAAELEKAARLACENVYDFFHTLFFHTHKAYLAI